MANVNVTLAGRRPIAVPQNRRRVAIPAGATGFPKTAVTAGAELRRAAAQLSLVGSPRQKALAAKIEAHANKIAPLSAE